MSSPSALNNNKRQKLGNDLDFKQATFNRKCKLSPVLNKPYQSYKVHKNKKRYIIIFTYNNIKFYSNFLEKLLKTSPF
jgi:F0F1-type ATP synthase delta subunit